ADAAFPGYPIADIEADGSFTLTKPPGTRGAVNTETCAEQLLYEVGDPAAYLTPDVVVDLTTLTLTPAGPDAVRVADVRGRPATDTYKVSIAYRDGFTASGTLVIVGPDAVAKAEKSGEILLARLKAAGHTYEHSYVEVLGGGDGVPGVGLRPEFELTDESGQRIGTFVPSSGISPPEVVLRVAVRDANKAAVERFTKEFAPLVTAGLAGTTGYTTGRPQVREVFAYWPALVAKPAV